VHRFVALDDGDLINGDCCRLETSADEVRGLELLQRLGVELGFENFEDIGKF
jgi:hypothetical protein